VIPAAACLVVKYETVQSSAWMRSNVLGRAQTSPGSTKCKKGRELYMARLYCRIVGPVLLVVGVLGVVQFGIPGFLSINELSRSGCTSSRAPSLPTLALAVATGERRCSTPGCSGSST
jgi:hypothetical protein